MAADRLMALVAQLRAKEFDPSSARAPYQRLVNPDGPEAADALLAERTRAEQAEAKLAALRSPEMRERVFHRIAPLLKLPRSEGTIRQVTDAITAIIGDSAPVKHD